MICQVVPCNIPLNLHKTVVQYCIWLYTAKNVRSNTAGFSIRVRHPRFFGKKKNDPKKPKLFSDVCVLFKHSNFCSRILEMQSKRPRLQNDSCSCIVLVTRAFGPRRLRLWHEFFSSPPTPKLLPPT